MRLSVLITAVICLSLAGISHAKRCPRGKKASKETRGKCCYPGQYWSRKARKCAGEPESCPETMRISGEACICPEGKTQNKYTAGRCCWPEQEWVPRRGCTGKPKCPDGYKQTDNGNACFNVAEHEAKERKRKAEQARKDKEIKEARRKEINYCESGLYSMRRRMQDYIEEQNKDYDKLRERCNGACKWEFDRYYRTKLKWHRNEWNACLSDRNLKDHPCYTSWWQVTDRIYTHNGKKTAVPTKPGQFKYMWGAFSKEVEQLEKQICETNAPPQNIPRWDDVITFTIRLQKYKTVWDGYGNGKDVLFGDDNFLQSRTYKCRFKRLAGSRSVQWKGYAGDKWKELKTRGAIGDNFRCN